MQTFTREIDGPADFELGRPRSAPLEYTATLPEGPARGLAFLIPGFGGDTDGDYAEALRRHVAQTHGMVAVSVRYHCYGSRPSTGAGIDVDPRDRLMLLGMAMLHKVPLDNLKDVNDVALRLSAAGVEVQARATLRPARGEYQNFGVMQAMDHLAVLGHLLETGVAFDTRRIVALGSSHGGYIAHMIAKLAPRTLAMVIDNSSYAQPPMDYLGHGEAIEFIGTLAEGVAICCRTESAWTHADRLAANFYDRDRDLIRDTAYPGHVASTRAAAGEVGTMYRMVNAAVDGISSPELKQRQVAVLRALDFDAQLSVIGEEQLDGKLFKRVVHGLDASLARLFDMAITDLKPREGGLDGELGASVAYECVDSIYRFTHSAAAPYVRGEVVSRFFQDEA
jgi:hypothetical protein